MWVNKLILAIEKIPYQFVFLLIYGYLMLFIEIFGLVGNLMSLCVLSHQSMKNSSSYAYLAALASADALLLCCSFLLYTLPALYDNYCVSFAMTPFVYPISLTLATSTTWIAVAVTFERFLAIFNSWSRVKVSKARLVYTSIFIISAIYNFPRWFELQFVAKLSNSTNSSQAVCWIESTAFGNRPFYRFSYYSLIYVAIRGIFPLVILIILNSYLIFKVHLALGTIPSLKQERDVELLARKVKKTRSRSLNAEVNETTFVRNTFRRRSHFSVIRINREINAKIWRTDLILIAIVGIFVICQIPCLVYNLAYSISDATYFRSNHWWQTLSIYRNFTATFQSAFNFILYCVIDNRFRKVLFSLIRPKHIIRWFK